MLDNENVYPVLPSVVTNTPPPFNTFNYYVSSTKKIYEGMIPLYTKLVSHKRKRYPGAEI